MVWRGLIVWSCAAARRDNRRYQMNITLKSIKYAAFASQETSCFEAAVYVDGKKVAVVENDGHGGCDMWHPWTAKDAVDAYAATLPEEVVDGLVDDDGNPVTIKPNADILIGNLLNAYLVERDFDRAVSKRILMKCADGRIVQTKTFDKATLARLLPTAAQNWPDAIILNNIPRAEALAVYRAAA
jgi:hypothetical protein